MVIRIQPRHPLFSSSSTTLHSVLECSVFYGSILPRSTQLPCEPKVPLSTATNWWDTPVFVWFSTPANPIAPGSLISSSLKSHLLVFKTSFGSSGLFSLSSTQCSFRLSTHSILKLVSICCSTIPSHDQANFTPANRTLEDLDEYYRNNPPLFVTQDEDAVSSKRPFKSVEREQNYVRRVCHASRDVSHDKQHADNEHIETAGVWFVSPFHVELHDTGSFQSILSLDYQLLLLCTHLQFVLKAKEIWSLSACRVLYSLIVYYLNLNVTWDCRLYRVLWHWTYIKGFLIT